MTLATTGLQGLKSLALIIMFSSLVAPFANAMPEELRRGMIQFEVDSEAYLPALAQIETDEIGLFPVDYAGAIVGMGLERDAALNALKRAIAKPAELEPIERFRIGKIYYQLGECVEALKAFKPLKNRLPLDLKQEWAFYRANCFIKLGSNKRAAQSLSDILNGPWVSNAYYNLAIAYHDSSVSKTKALVALRVASTLNEGDSRFDQALNDRIFYAAGSIYLNEGKPDFAEKFFKRIHLDSMAAPQGLYLNGLSKLEQKDFRAATQSWFSAKKYATIRPGVAESMLAIPYAYEGAGYTSQALEAYLEASNTFKKELGTLKKITDSIKQHGLRKVLIEEHKLEGLEWFLAKDVARNTQRAAYYGHLVSNPEIYAVIEQLLELIKLEENLNLWLSQLSVFDSSLKNKSRSYTKSRKKLSLSKVQAQIKTLKQRAKRANEQGLDSVSSQDIETAIKSLADRLSSTRTKVDEGLGSLKAQQEQVNALRTRTKAKLDATKRLVGEYDDYATSVALAQFKLLKRDLASKFERAEQGLVHILESVAESRTRPRNLLDGRYQ